MHNFTRGDIFIIPYMYNGMIIWVSCNYFVTSFVTHLTVPGLQNGLDNDLNLIG